MWEKGCGPLNILPLPAGTKALPLEGLGRKRFCFLYPVGWSLQSQFLQYHVPEGSGCQKHSETRDLPHQALGKHLRIHSFLLQPRRLISSDSKGQPLVNSISRTPSLLSRELESGLFHQYLDFSLGEIVVLLECSVSTLDEVASIY